MGNDSASRSSRSVVFFGRVLLLLFLLTFVVDFLSEEQIDDPSSGGVSSRQVKHETPSNKTVASGTNDHGDDDDDSKHSICSILPDFRTSSARYTWIKHIQQIHSASRLEDDIHFLRHDFTAKLLALATPRLDDSIRTSTKDWQLVSRLLDKAYQRYRYLVRRQRQRSLQADDSQQNDHHAENEVEPPPVRIMVLGGSVAVGIQCRTGIPGHEYDDSTTRYCAWPHRLENLINQLFGVGTLVEVQNEAVGGTYTDIGSSILKYDLIEGVLESDILIHAFSTNDVTHVSSRSLYTFMLSLQEFCRLVYQPPRKEFCRSKKRVDPPLHSKASSIRYTQGDFHYPFLIHVNDAIGQLMTPLARYARMPQVVSSLANYYGFVSLSYPDMVRDVVYGDPKETWFSANEFPDGTTHVPNVHPGQGMHIVVAWMVAYSLLQTTITYCTLTYDFWGLEHSSKGSGSAESDDDDWVPSNLFSYMKFADYDETVLSEVIPLYNNGTDPLNEGTKPHFPPPAGLLPAIDNNMTMSELNARWKIGSKEMQMSQKRPCPRDAKNARDDPTCPFSWVSGHQQSKGMAWIEDNVVKRLTPANNWTMDLNFNFRKMGLTPPTGKIGSTMSMEFELRSLGQGQPISRVVVFYLKSYGATWKDSKARIEVFTSSTEEKEHALFLNSTDLSGYHSRSTSEMHLMELVLGKQFGQSNENRSLVLQATLVSGQTFKIMGLALCR